MDSVPGFGRYPEGRHGNPVKYSCLENPKDRGAWQAMVHRSQRIGHDWSNWAHRTARHSTRSPRNRIYIEEMINLHTGIRVLSLSLHIFGLSVQFISVTCVWLCGPMGCTTPGFPVHHQLLKLVQTHVHWVGDAILPFHPLSSPSPSTFNLSQHRSLFQWVSSSHQVAKVLEFQLQFQSFQWIFSTDFL